MLRCRPSPWRCRWEPPPPTLFHPNNSSNTGRRANHTVAHTSRANTLRCITSRSTTITTNISISNSKCPRRKTSACQPATTNSSIAISMFLPATVGRIYLRAAKPTSSRLKNHFLFSSRRLQITNLKKKHANITEWIGLSKQMRLFLKKTLIILLPELRKLILRPSKWGDPCAAQRPPALCTTTAHVL